MIKLSIITINYNNAPGLQKTIDSVINQTSRDFEYIVIDGGSTDGSVAVIQKKIDKISFWVSEPDRGIYHAMNKGILFAKGEYCQFLNSGDYLLNTTVTEEMLNEMPECSIFYGNEMQEIDGKQIIKKTTQVDKLRCLICTTQQFLTLLLTLKGHYFPNMDYMMNR